MSVTEQPQEQQLPAIPHDIILDILSRLPTKSLLKFRCVCKSWNTLTRNKKFTQFHLKRTITDPSQTRALLSMKPFWSIKYDDLDDFGKDGCDVVVKKKIPSALACLGSNKDFEIVGECDGLICIVSRKPRRRSNLSDPIERSYCLWNPSMEEGWEITRNDVANDMVVTGSMFSVEFGNTKWFEVIGFGYDPTIDDYKIVRLVSYKLSSDGVEVEIFTMGKRTWMKKVVTHACDGLIGTWSGPKTPHCLFVNGSFHWVFERRMGKLLILSFDLEKERVEEVIPFPDSCDKLLFHGCQLRVIGGKLAFLTEPGAGDCEIWVMDEYGVGTSWTKMVTLCEVPDVNTGTCLSLVCFSRTGGVLMCVNGCHYMMYDPQDKTCKRYHHRPRPLRYWPSVSIYVESLISPFCVPNADGERVEQVGSW